MYFKTTLACVLCLACPLVWGQAVSSRFANLEKNIQASVQQQTSKPDQTIILKRAQKYIYAYYGREDFSGSEWVRVQNFLTWLKQNQTRLDQQFQTTIGDKWNQFPANKQEVVLGAWLGMKYAVEKIGGTIDKSFPIVLEEKIWNTECGDYSDRGKIYCSKGDFISKINISLHEAVHLLPYLKQPYRSSYGFEDSYREKYTVAAQLRYALPAKISNYGGGTRSFFPLLKTKQKLELLNEYAEGIAALIDYEKIWASTPWPLHEDNSNESLDMRLRAVVFDELGVSSNGKNKSSYSLTVNNYFNAVGQQIANTYCKNLPAEKEAQIEFIHACMDEHAADILQLAAQKLKPLVSKKIPPIPAGYH